MELNLVIFIMLIHWLADCCLQTNGQAINKWHRWQDLAWHVLTYSLVWLVVGLVMSSSIITGLLFFSITYIFHFATDYFTSKVTHRLFENKEYHDGFVMVIGDQILHFIQLFLTFKYLM